MRRAFYLIIFGNLVIIPGSAQSGRLIWELLSNIDRTARPLRYFNTQKTYPTLTKEKQYEWNKGFVPKQNIPFAQANFVEEKVTMRIFFDPYRSLPYYRKEESCINRSILTRKSLFNDDAGS